MTDVFVSGVGPLMSAPPSRPRGCGLALPTFRRQELQAALADALDESRRRDLPLDVREHSIDVYLHANPLLSRFFWRRFSHLVRLTSAGIQRGEIDQGSALDLGGGSGMLSALMSPAFDEIRLIDRNCAFARILLAGRGTANVSCVEIDALLYQPERRFDVVFAADVLEHFRELDPIVARIKQWLAPGGGLVTSLPSENLVYQALRVPFGKQKPEDHYHKAVEVEAVLRRHGFRRVRADYHPLHLPIAPLFHFGIWKT